MNLILYQAQNIGHFTKLQTEAMAIFNINRNVFQFPV